MARPLLQLCTLAQVPENPSRQAGKPRWIQQTPMLAATCPGMYTLSELLLFTVVPSQHFSG